VSAITFDLWHTLVYLSPEDEDRYLALQLDTLAEILRTSPPAREGTPAEVCGPQEAVRETFRRASEEVGRGRALAELACDAARRAGREPAAERWVQACERLVSQQPFRAVPGALDQLRRVRAWGFRTGVVSNLLGETGRAMRKILQELGLAPYLEVQAFSDELPWAKPAPEIFWAALRPLETRPEDAIHIGDLPNDVLGARAAGYRQAVRFDGARSYGDLYRELCHPDEPISPPPERILRSWEELPGLLSQTFP
jgi:FMN phosphatase YigB (HAD superfamily)